MAALIAVEVEAWKHPPTGQNPSGCFHTRPTSFHVSFAHEAQRVLSIARHRRDAAIMVEGRRRRRRRCTIRGKIRTSHLATSVATPRRRKKPRSGLCGGCCSSSGDLRWLRGRPLMLANKAAVCVISDCHHGDSKQGPTGCVLMNKHSSLQEPFNINQVE